jgi:hypothetical protein
MHRTRTALVVLALAGLTAAVAGCGNQPAATTSTVAGLTAVAKTAAPAPTTTSVARTPAAPTTSPRALRTAAPTTSRLTTKAPPVVMVTATSARLHFATPEASMRYLAAAWNANDLTALKHVTQGQARLLLLGMHNEAVNLRLDHCALRPGGKGDYLCHFNHDYPASYPVKAREGTHGTAEFIAAPSSSVGWYMFAYEGCG